MENKILLDTSNMYVVHERSESKTGTAQKHSKITNTAEYIQVAQTTIAVTAQGAPIEGTNHAPGVQVTFSTINDTEGYNEMSELLKKAAQNTDKYGIRVIVEFVDKSES